VYNYNPTLTNVTSSSTENTIRTEIANYATTYLQEFNKTFRRSNLLTIIDGIDDAILNSRMDVRLQQRFTPTIGTSKNYTLNFPVALATADDVNYIIGSTRLTVQGQSVTIKNKLSSNILQLVTSNGIVVVDNLGSYNATTGVVTIQGLNPSSFIDDEVKLFVIPANQSTVRPLLNYILDIDTTRTTVTTLIDRENTNVIL